MKLSPIESKELAELDDELNVGSGKSSLSAPAPAPAPASNKGSPYESMNLKVGDRLQVQPPPKLTVERCNVRFIGSLQDQSLLITAPVLASGVRLDLMEGDNLVIRIFSSQNAFAFACEVLRVCKLPYGYLHVSFPQVVQGTVIRKAPRIKIKIGVMVGTDKDKASEVPGVISNLSSNGALLDGRRNIAEVGDTLHLSFHLKLHNIDVNLSLVGNVRAIIGGDKPEQSSSSLSQFGLEFVDLTPNDKMILQSMVYQQMIERPETMV